MFDCSKDVIAHHDQKVTLPQAERTQMRERRDANRDRLKRGLKRIGKPLPREFVKQGSYAMKTMTQHPENDYDIDDGVYFDKEVLVGDRGAQLSALQVRQFVRDAIDDGSFKTSPEVRTNCVRVYYAAGYHVDLPIYRRVRSSGILGNITYYYELASSDWKRSDARNVTDWFEQDNINKSSDTDNGRQLRRIVRQIKKYARSRASWKGQTINGFGITKLVSECYRGNASREDMALYNTMKAIRDRLNSDLEITHPVTPNATITTGTDDARARFFRDRLTEAIDSLLPLFGYSCDRKTALKSWDKVFATTFFSDRSEIIAKEASSLLRTPSAAVPAAPFTFPNAPRVDDKPRGFGSCGG
jgi:hypothetical protein